jgi:defect in organelle trafficking protein DotC
VKGLRNGRFIATLVLVLVAFVAPRSAALADNDYVRPAAPAAYSSPPLPGEPPRLEYLQNIRAENAGSTGMPFDVRNDAMKQAALSYGARGGLAFRTWSIRHEMEGRAGYMDKVFDFRQLLIPAPSGMLIEPPVISEEVKAMIIDTAGTEAAIADRVYDIAVNARIVGAARSWRNYVERDWGEVTPPPDQLRPATDAERKKWKEWVLTGWNQGIAQADEIFAADLAQLTADYEGMVRYRMLLAQGMVTPPYASQTDRGVTGGGKKMRVGDRDVQLTSIPELVSGSDAWQPASR